MCAGGLSPEAYRLVLEDFGSIPQCVFSTPRMWQGLRLALGNGVSRDEFIELNRHHRAGLYSTVHPEIPAAVTCIWRDRFDSWLLEQSGADTRDECRLVDIETDRDGRPVVHLLGRDHAAPRVLGCSYLIGADGAASTTRRLLNPSFASTVSWFSIYEEWYEGSVQLDPDWYYVFLNDEFSAVFSSFYSKDQYLVYTSVTRKGGTPKQGHRRFIDDQARRYGLTIRNVCRRWGCLVNNMGARAAFTFGSGRVLLAGEAGGFIGFCGEGVSGALVSGRLAADSIVGHFEDPRAVLEAYQAGTEPLRKRIRDEHEVGKRLPGRAYGDYAGGSKTA